MTDHNPNYGADEFHAALAEQGYVTDIGQIGPGLLKRIAAAVEAGRLVKYRACWNTGSPRFGISCMKTCWTTSGCYHAPENDWFFGRGPAQSEAA